MIRFCGERYIKGIYYTATIESLMKLNTPLFNFIVNPPIPIYDHEALGISTQGQSYLPLSYLPDGTPHRYAIYDWVGRDYTPSDFTEEFLRWGLSSRMPYNRNNPNALLQNIEMMKKSDWYYYVSPLAIINDEFLPYYYRERIEIFGKPCIKDIPEHIEATADHPTMCASLWWEDLPASDLNKVANKGPRVITRGTVDTQYLCARHPQELNGKKIEHTAGVFLAVPIPAFELNVIYDPVDHEHEDIMNLIENAAIDVPVRVTID